MTDMRDFQAWVATTIQAERAARGMTLKALAEQSGVAERVLIRALKSERDLNTEQLAGIARALDLRPSYLLAEAERRRDMAPAVTPLSRSQIAGFLAAPASDETLNARLSDARASAGAKGTELTELLERVTQLRRDELLRMQWELDRAERPLNHRHGGQ